MSEQTKEPQAGDEEMAGTTSSHPMRNMGDSPWEWFRSLHLHQKVPAEAAWNTVEAVLGLMPPTRGGTSSTALRPWGFFENMVAQGRGCRRTP